MRVLWLTPAQLPAVAGESPMVGGGWLEGLRDALERFEPGIELGVASRGPALRRPLKRGNATYFAVGPWGRSQWQSMADAWRLSSVQQETIADALRVIESFRPDLIHVHGTEHELGFAALRAGLPAVATLQGLATVCEHFMFDAVTLPEVVRNTATRSFVEGNGLLPNYYSMRRRAVDERAIIRGLDCFMGQTEWDRTVLELLHPAATYFHTECVVRSPFYQEQWSPPDNPQQTIFCTGGAAPYKGLETLLAALGILRTAGKRGLRLRVAGTVRGSPVWPALSGIVARSGTGDQVAWLGPLPAADLVSELKRADVFVLPSHIENQPNSLIEAMLLGVPSVAAAVGGVPELVTNAVSGLLYHDREPFALAGALTRLLGDRDYARALGREARRVARERHDPETIAHRTSAVYDAVLAETAR